MSDEKDEPTYIHMDQGSQEKPFASWPLSEIALGDGIGAISGSNEALGHDVFLAHAYYNTLTALVIDHPEFVSIFQEQLTDELVALLTGKKSSAKKPDAEDMHLAKIDVKNDDDNVF